MFQLCKIFHRHFIMDDKKRKKFGLSLKSSKKLTVTKSEVKEQSSVLCNEFSSNTSLKEAKDVVVLGAEKPKCIEEICDFSNSINLSISSRNGFEPDNLGCVDFEERERNLWKNLFSVSSSVNWESMEDLPISDVPYVSVACKASSFIESEFKENSTKFEENNNTNLGSLTSGCKTNEQTEAFNIDYKDLPKPCIACYTRKLHPLVWPEGDKTEYQNDIPEESINDNIMSCEDSALDLSIKKNFKINHLSTNNAFQVSYECHKSDSLRHQWNNGKPTGALDKKVECQKSFLQNNSNKNKTIKSNYLSLATEGKRNSSPDSSILYRKTTNAVIDLTNEDTEKTSNKGRKFGASTNSSSTMKMQTFFKRYDCTNPERSSSFVRTCLKAENENTSNQDKSERKEKDSALKKEILNSCPMCQFQFPQNMSKQGIDQHISKCIGNEEMFLDDEEDW